MALGPNSKYRFRRVSLVLSILAILGCTPAQNAAGAISSLANGVVDNLFVSNESQSGSESLPQDTNSESKNRTSAKSRKRKQLEKARTEKFEDFKSSPKIDESISGSERPDDL